MDLESGGVGPLAPRAGELLRIVARTPVRIAILSTLVEERVDLRDLSDRLHPPRSTLRHNLERLIEGNLVTETLNNKYRATPLGCAVLDGLKAFDEHVRAAIKLEPLFDCLPPSQLDIGVCDLSTGTVVAATKADPYAPQLRLTELLEDASTVCAYVPTYPFMFNRKDGSIFGGGHCEISLLIPSEVADNMDVTYTDNWETDGQEGQLDIGVLDTENVDYGIAVIDDRAVILGFDKNKPHALVETTEESCLRWARERIEQLQASATPLGTTPTRQD